MKEGRRREGKGRWRERDGQRGKERRDNIKKRDERGKAENRCCNVISCNHFCSHFGGFCGEYDSCL